MSDAQPRVTIPRQELPKLRVLANTDPAVLQKLSEILKEQPTSLRLDRITKGMVESSGVEPQTVDSFVQLLWGWTMVRRRLDLTAGDLIACLTAALDGLSESEWTDKDRQGWDAVSSELQQLLSVDTPVSLGAKAIELLLDQNLTFCTSRVITDTRPVFDDEAEKVNGMLAFHTLVLHCHEGSQTRDIYIALDIDDIVSLRGQLERAERKERLVTSSLKEAGSAMIATSERSTD